MKPQTILFSLDQNDGTNSFLWPTPITSEPARKWRAAAEQVMYLIIQNDYGRQGMEGMAEKVQWICGLNLTLIARQEDILFDLLKDTHGDANGFRAWEHFVGAQADLLDRLAVLDFLAHTLAKCDSAAGMGTAMVARWVGWITTLAWQDETYPVWLEDGARDFLTKGGPRGLPEPSIKHLYRPWGGENDSGLCGDFMYFLNAFNKHRKKASSELFEHVVIRRSIVLFRALCLNTPEKVPPNLVLLLNETESLLNMEPLKHQQDVGLKAYGSIRAEWDRRILERHAKSFSNVVKENAESTQTRRIL
jgi:hypothetical protein